MKRKAGIISGICACMLLSLGTSTVASEQEMISSMSTVEDMTIGGMQSLQCPDYSWYCISTDYQPGIAVRDYPDPSGTLLTRLPDGTEFFVEETSGIWGYTCMPGYEGWINLDYAEVIYDEPLYDAYMDYVIVSDYQPGIAVRSIPSANGVLLTRIPEGTYFYVERVCGVWGYTVEAMGYEGWINLDYAYPVDTPEDELIDFYILPSSSSVRLTQAEIEGLSLQELCYARNEIYARHGRLFKSKELMEYFTSQNWYGGRIAPENFQENLLNYVEQSNVLFLYNWEHRIASKGYVLDQPGYDITAVYPAAAFVSGMEDTNGFSGWDAPILTEEEAYDAVYEYIDATMDAETIYQYQGYIVLDEQTPEEYVIKVRSYTGAIGYYYVDKYSGDVYSAWISPVTGGMDPRQYEFTIS